jgi:hypothetical protein
MSFMPIVLWTETELNAAVEACLDMSEIEREGVHYVAI